MYLFAKLKYQNYVAIVVEVLVNIKKTEEVLSNSFLVSNKFGIRAK